MYDTPDHDVDVALKTRSNIYASLSGHNDAHGVFWCYKMTHKRNCPETGMVLCYVLLRMCYMSAEGFPNRFARYLGMGPYVSRSRAYVWYGTFLQ
jgi:hypothetical protein